MYQIVTGNMTLNFERWNEDEFRKMMRVRIGEHSLTVEEGTHLEGKVAEVFIYPRYSKCKKFEENASALKYCYKYYSNQP